MSKTLYESLNDILANTHHLGFIDSIKIEGTEEKTIISTILEDKSVVLNAYTNSPIGELAGQTIGFARMGVLDGFMKYPQFQDKESGVIKFNQETRNGESIVSEISFQSASNSKANYRVVGKATIEKQLNVPQFNGAEWDIEYSPTVADVQNLKYLAGILSSYETAFTTSVEDGILTFIIGSNKSDGTKVSLDSNNLVENGEVSSNLAWPLDKVLTILQSGIGYGCKIFLSNRGALKINIDTGLGHYEYILTAKPV